MSNTISAMDPKQLRSYSKLGKRLYDIHKRIDRFYEKVKDSELKARSRKDTGYLLAAAGVVLGTAALGGFEVAAYSQSVATALAGHSGLSPSHALEVMRFISNAPDPGVHGLGSSLASGVREMAHWVGLASEKTSSLASIKHALSGIDPVTMGKKAGFMRKVAGLIDRSNEAINVSMVFGLASTLSTAGAALFLANGKLHERRLSDKDTPFRLGLKKKLVEGQMRQIENTKPSVSNDFEPS